MNFLSVTHKWSVGRRICDAAPVFLAGGLDAANVREPIAAVQPCAADLCSGVPTGGKLDAGQLRRFLGAVVSGSGRPL